MGDKPSAPGSKPSAQVPRRPTITYAVRWICPHSHRHSPDSGIKKRVAPKPARVIYDYAHVEPFELSVTKGQIVTVLEIVCLLFTMLHSLSCTFLAVGWLVLLQAGQGKLGLTPVMLMSSHSTTKGLVPTSYVQIL
jgi:hypothetical protein